MKKFFIAIALVAMLGFVAVPANALIGIPDDVPGNSILIPWIYVSMPGFGTENTLITITEVNGKAQPLHLWINDIDSVPAYNWDEPLTPFDVYVTDGLTIINQMSPIGRAALEIDTDGDGVSDHWAGYIYAYNDDASVQNNLISNCYQVYLPAGMAAAFNGASLEFTPPYLNVVGQTNFPVAHLFNDLRPVEAFSAQSLSIGKSGLAGVALVAATSFRLMPRYYVNDAVGQNLLMIWVESNYTGVAPPGLLHVNFFDEAENVLSSNIPLPHELNIINIRDILPAGLFPGAYPWGGWINIQTPDLFGNGFSAIRPWLGYSWQRAIGPAAQAWEVIHPAHRNATPPVF